MPTWGPLSWSFYLHFPLWSPYLSVCLSVHCSALPPNYNNARGAISLVCLFAQSWHQRDFSQVLKQVVNLSCFTLFGPLVFYLFGPLYSIYGPSSFKTGAGTELAQREDFRNLRSASIGLCSFLFKKLEWDKTRMTKTSGWLDIMYVTSFSSISYWSNSEFCPAVVA